MLSEGLESQGMSTEISTGVPEELFLDSINIFILKLVREWGVLLPRR